MMVLQQPARARGGALLAAMRRRGLPGLVLIAGLFAAGCATSRMVGRADAAAARGDFDTAVGYYRQALAREPGRVDLRIQLERTTRLAAAEHIRRARELEAQDQLTGALAEYRLAADLDPTATLAASKATELERRIRAMAEAARPQPRIETLREQAAQTSPIPRLDPRTQVSELRFANAAVRDVLKTISDLTGINITYDQALTAGPALNQPYTIDIRQMSLEDVLNQVMQANGLTFKVVNPQTIFVFQDTQAKRIQFEDQYTQTFYLSNADATEIMGILTPMLTGTAVQPRIQANKSANALVVRATAPVLQFIERLIRSNDRPKPEVMIEAEILEVDRQFIRKLGIDLSQYALGFTFSPELAPPNTESVPEAFPSGPPPFNLNTISRGVSAADFYMTSPTALIRLLESNTNTKILAKPQLRGRDGEAMVLRLGDSIPIPQTTFNAAAAGGVANIPTTQVQYQAVGVNLLFTPRVTYQDEIVLNGLTLEKSGLGNFLTVAGQSFPTIVTRSAAGSIRLRDGESNLVAGLLRDDDRTTLRSFPGITRIPLLRALFGNSDRQVDQTDIVMIITPHIIRSHDLTPEDLRPQYVGAGQNLGGSTPPLISLDAISGALAGPLAAAPGAPAPGAVTTPATPPAAAAAAPPRAPGVVPIEAVPSGGVPTAAQPAGATRVVLTAPTPSPDGSIAAGGGPHTVPITISGAPPIVSIALTVTFDPAVIRTPTVTLGSFMSQGGVAPTFSPRTDTPGRIDLVIARPPTQVGASGSGLLAAIAFVGGAPGATDLAVTGVAMSASGQTVPMEFTPTRLIVK
jgi:type II secretory pathway component GspD/PulD (secretin)